MRSIKKLQSYSSRFGLQGDWPAEMQERSERFTSYVHAQVTKEKEIVKADLLTKLNSLNQIRQ